LKRFKVDITKNINGEVASGVIYVNGRKATSFTNEWDDDHYLKSIEFMGTADLSVADLYNFINARYPEALAEVRSLYNPDTGLNEIQRTVTVSKNFSIANPSAETTIWTPSSGKQFRMMGFVILKAANTAKFDFRDNTGGTIIFSIKGVVATLIPFVFPGNGLLSTAPNNVLTVKCPDTGQTDGTVFGTEE
jgi:hypothetical protein